jgi:small subunit ribosomal protein S20
VAHSLSAKKRVRQNERQKMVNRTRRSKVKSEIKKLEESLLAGNADAAQAQFKLVTKKLDQVSSTSTMHKKTASRKKSRLAKRVNALKGKTA